MNAGLTARQRAGKRAFDLTAAGVGMVLTSPLLLAGWAVAAVSTRSHGFFRQVRIGRDGEPFGVLKLRTMRAVAADANASTVTTAGDARITRAGAHLRRFKLDELPQLLNVLLGQMSLVGPRPDVPGFADRLTGADRVVLSVRPGITCPASLAYRDEEQLLAAVADPERYNREVLWPDKVRLNRAYVENWTFRGDLRCLVATLTGVTGRTPSGDADVVEAQ